MTSQRPDSSGLGMFKFGQRLHSQSQRLYHTSQRQFCSDHGQSSGRDQAHSCDKETEPLQGQSSGLIKDQTCDTTNGQGSGLSHVDSSGQARMVGVGGKQESRRVAVAEGRILLGQEAFLLVQVSDKSRVRSNAGVGAGAGAKLFQENRMKKGSVLGVSQVAGIMAAKATSGLIPLCHPLLLTE